MGQTHTQKHKHTKLDGVRRGWGDSVRSLETTFFPLEKGVGLRLGTHLYWRRFGLRGVVCSLQLGAHEQPASALEEGRPHGAGERHQECEEEETLHSHKDGVDVQQREQWSRRHDNPDHPDDSKDHN